MFTTEFRTLILIELMTNTNHQWILSDIALTLVEAVIKADNLYIEGEIAHEIRLFGKDQELLWASED